MMCWTTMMLAQTQNMIQGAKEGVVAGMVDASCSMVDAIRSSSFESRVKSRCPRRVSDSP